MSEPLWIEYLNFSCLSEKFRGILGWVCKDLWDTIHETEILKKMKNMLGLYWAKLSSSWDLLYFNKFALNTI